MNFGDSLLDFRNENGKMLCCVNVYYKEKKQTTKQKVKRNDV